MISGSELIEIFDYRFDNVQNRMNDTLKLFNIVSEENLLLEIRKILWNESDIIEEEKYDHLLIPVLRYYIDNKIDLVDLKVFLNLGEQLGFLDNSSKLGILYILNDDLSKNIEEAMEFLYLQFTEFGLNYPPFHQVYKFLRKIGIKSNDFLEELVSKSISLQSRPEYIEEILSNSSVKELITLSKWSNPEIRKLLVDHCIDTHTNDMHPKSFEEFISKQEKIRFMSQFPLSFQVYPKILPELPPQTPDMGIIEKIPKDFSREWLPKFVYSKPDIPEKINIYFPGGNNIGHSAIVIKTNYGSFLMDFGMSVVNNSIPSWFPLLEKLDFILISHAHMDHSGAMPLLYGKKSQLPWFALPATKTMTEMLWYDTRSIIRNSYTEKIISSNEFLDRLISKGSIINTLQNFNEIKLGENYKMLPNVNIEAKSSAHLFGSTGFEIEIGNKSILYTGDFNIDNGADFRKDMDLTIFDGTYFKRYSSNPDPNQELKNLLDKSKRILIPAFSMGRSQEILFKLKKLGAEKEWKIYLTGMASRLASKLGLNVGSSGGGQKKGVILAKTVSEEEFSNKTIVIGGQGMLQAGTSRKLFEATSDDPNTSVVLCGYQAPNTLGYHLLQNQDYLSGKYKQNIIRIKMSGHTSGETLDKFIDNQYGRKIMVHTPIGSFNNNTREDLETPHPKNKVNEPIKL